MNDNLEKILTEKYPQLFKDKSKSPKETLICFGCECGDGWFKILDHLFGYMTGLMNHKLIISYTDEYRKQFKNHENYYTDYSSYEHLPPQITLVQVKEKYGTLRVYYDFHTEEEIPESILVNLNKDDLDKQFKRYYDAIDSAINYAEYQTSVTCEVTGKDGTLYTKGWYTVLCDEEALAKGYKTN